MEAKLAAWKGGLIYLNKNNIYFSLRSGQIKLPTMEITWRERNKERVDLLGV